MAEHVMLGQTSPGSAPTGYVYVYGSSIDGQMRSTDEDGNEFIYRSDLVRDADASTITFNLNSSMVHFVSALGGNRTLAISGDKEGDRFMIGLKQDNTGSRIPVFFSTILWASGGVAPTLTTTSNSVDYFGFLVISAGATYHGFEIGMDVK